MTTLAEHLQRLTTLEASEIEWIHLVVGDWQLVADLSFSDLVLWVPGGHEGWQTVAHVRPNTGPMVFHEDVVGKTSSRGRAWMLDQAYRERRVVAGRSPRPGDETGVREEAIPVVRLGRAIAVITRHSHHVSGRTPSRLELTYRDLAEALSSMIARGEFPSPSSPTGLRRGAPRVGDGVVVLDGEPASLTAGLEQVLLPRPAVVVAEGDAADHRPRLPADGDRITDRYLEDVDHGTRI